MKILATLFTAIVALIHVGIVIIEMFLWNLPIGRQIFGTTESFAAEATDLAANQGLYNGFLIAGLLWGLFTGRRDVVIFFLLCVIVAGIFGAITVSPTIFGVQSIPALLALGATLVAKRD